MNNTKSTITALILVIAVGLAGWLLWSRGQDQNSNETESGVSIAERQAIDQTALRADYRTAVSGLLPRYTEALEAGDSAALTAVQSELMDLRLPPAERDAHVALVLIIDRRLAGATAVEAQSALAELQAQYVWLAVE